MFGKKKPSIIGAPFLSRLGEFHASFQSAHSVPIECASAYLFYFSRSGRFKLGFSKSHSRPVPAKSGCGPGANIVSTSGQPPGADISYEAVPLIYVEIFRAQATINLPGQQTSNSQNPSAIDAAVVDMISRAHSACSSIKYLSAKAITLGCQRQVARLCGS